MFQFRWQSYAYVKYHFLKKKLRNVKRVQTLVKNQSFKVLKDNYVYFDNDCIKKHLNAYKRPCYISSIVTEHVFSAFIIKK